MKIFAALALLIVLVAIAFVGIPNLASEASLVGVREGDWIEYNVSVTGNCPPVHKGVVWMRMEVLKVEGSAFPLNMTLKFDNGTMDSSIWDFNFTEGNTEGWLIIPARLSPGETFFDNFAKTDKQITIQSQELKTILGASRVVTYGNDSYRQKMWDKNTGVFVESLEVFKNWTAAVQAVATNMWTPHILGLTQSEFYEKTTWSVGLTALVVLIVIIAAKRKGVKFLERRRA